MSVCGIGVSQLPLPQCALLLAALPPRTALLVEPSNNKRSCPTRIWTEMPITGLRPSHYSLIGPPPIILASVIIGRFTEKDQPELRRKQTQIRNDNTGKTSTLWYLISNNGYKPILSPNKQACRCFQLNCLFCCCESSIVNKESSWFLPLLNNNNKLQWSTHWQIKKTKYSWGALIVCRNNFALWPTPIQLGYANPFLFTKNAIQEDGITLCCQKASFRNYCHQKLFITTDGRAIDV